jgi:hypothetical protein
MDWPVLVQSVNSLEENVNVVINLRVSKKKKRVVLLTS